MSRFPQSHDISQGDAEMFSRRVHVAIIAATFVLLGSATAALATDVDPPVPATIPLTAGQPVKGQITAFTDETVQLVVGDSSVEVKWVDVKPQAVLALHERLLAKSGTAEQWLRAGETLMAVPGGKPLAERPFARAMRLDPTLKPKIEAARRGKPTSRSAAGGNAGGRGDGAGAGDDAAPGVTWGRQDEAQRAQTVERLKKRADEMTAKAKLKLTLYETKYFLFYSDLTRTEALRWVEVLDTMYARMAALFGVPAGENIWHGKAVVFVFFKRDDFRAFEKAVFNIDKDAGGRCHQRGDGSVYITFFRADPPDAFARVLVHEATHGFLFRYRARARIPSWANEGLAEVMEFELVPGAGIKQSEDARARAALRVAAPLKNFFSGEQIDFTQYPIARTMTEFMIRQNKRGYVDFINGIKDGQTVEAALKDKFGMSIDALVAAYGQSMGMPGLRSEVTTKNE